MIKLLVRITLFLSACVLTGCLSTGKIVTKPDATVLELDEEYSVMAELGKGAVEFESRENLARFGMFKRGPKEGEYLLVLYPNSVKGEIEIDLRGGISEVEARSEASEKYSSYFDRLLRAHRLILRGNFVNAKRLIKRIEDDFDAGYGTAVLLGNMALLQGDLDEAAKHFRVAHELRPKADDVTKFVPRKERVK